MPEIRVIEPIIFAPAEKLRVCAYARVSSDSTDQRNSFASQVNYYTKYIQAHEGWTFVDIYADQGITGTSALKRDEFLRLMRDCRQGKIDRILVKSVSRFARNAQDCIEAVRELRQLGVTVYFEKEHIPRDIFQEVQLEIARRSSKRKVSCRRTKSGRGKYTSKYALSERTVCGECGAMYRRTMWIKRDRTKEDVWRCVNRLEFGTKYCKHSPSLKEPILHQAILNCIQSVFHNKEEIAEAVREAQKKIILFEDAKNNPEVIRQRMQDIDHGMANLLTLAAQSSQIELFEKKFKEMTEEKARLTEQLKQAEEDATTDAKRQKQLDDILKAIDIDIVELTEFDDTFIRRIVEQVTILSKDKIEVRFIGGFSKVGDIPTK